MSNSCRKDLSLSLSIVFLPKAHKVIIFHPMKKSGAQLTSMIQKLINMDGKCSLTIAPNARGILVKRAI